jgi:enoyl-CoA hydratase/carnithine racemase
MARLEMEGAVAVLWMGDGDNRLGPDAVAELNKLLDEVEAGPATALVTSASGKIWSNGLDTGWFAAHPDQVGGALQVVEQLFARLLAFPLPTVAALQGHTFAGGAMLALCHDLRVMRADRGFFCLPEVDLGVAFTPGMTALLTSRLAPQTAHAAMVLAQRFGGRDALAAGIADLLAGSEPAVLEQAVSVARSVAGKDRATVAAIKRSLYPAALGLLGAEPDAATVASLRALAGEG